MSASKRVLAPTILGSIVLVLSAGPARAQGPVGTAFTYQGRLTDGGGPASGAYDLELRLFAGASGGSPVVPPLVREDVAVANGLFTVTVDFGAAAFTGSARWLEIGVRPGASLGAFTTLAPRQELTPTPNALFSSATPWTGLLGVPPGFADGTDDDSGGDITSVSAGTGLTGGASAGAATLAVDTAAIQSRVTGSCPPGQSIRTVNPDGTVVCEADDMGAGWNLTGNAGTNPATDFLGTTDNQPLVLRMNNTVALRLLGGTGTPSVVGGFSGNDVTAGVEGAFIGGGGFAGFTNRVTDNHGVVAGGIGNRAGNDTGTPNDAYGATVAGGLGNTASAFDATVGGGNGNTASGAGAVVPGGYSNLAGGHGSFAGGFKARVRDAATSGDADGDEGSFVWADYAPPFNFFTSSGPNQFLIRAGGGVGINTNAPAFPLDVDGVIRSRSGGFQFPDGTNQATASVNPAADITGVTAGAGLTGGGLSGSVTLAVNTATIQSRVTGTCLPGQSIRTVIADGTVVCEVDDTGWGLTGNAGTNPATNFIGTTDNQPFVLRTNGIAGLRLVPGIDTPNLVGGHPSNAITPGIDGAAIAGGGAVGSTNQVTDNFGSVGGGVNNRAGNAGGTLSDAAWATVAGGTANQAAGAASTVAGGSTNSATADYAAVGGGTGNTASGLRATVPGGWDNHAGGSNSLAAGFRARVRDAAASGDANGDEGTFIWSDESADVFTSSGPNQFLVRAAGGVGINTNVPAFALDVNGAVRSQFGGFHFPDGTSQTTAATNPAADITAVNTVAGSGLQGGVASGAANLSVAFGGTGTAGTVSRSDHHHLGQTWVGATTPGLKFLVSGVAAMGLWSESSSSDGRGVFGWGTSATGSAVGVWGESMSTSGRGVFGRATAGSGLTYGVYGENASTGGRGVAGAATAPTGSVVGVWGETLSTSGRGVSGLATAGTGLTYGVYGENASTGGRGVAGAATALTGDNYGVLGRAASTSGSGVFGVADATSGGTSGVLGMTNSPVGVGVRGLANGFTGTNYGVLAMSASTEGTGVRGWVVANTGLTTGVLGETDSSSGRGVHGLATSTAGSTTGVLGETSAPFGFGVRGASHATAGPGRGAEGTAASPDGVGVHGWATATTGFSTGVWGRNDSLNGVAVYGLATSTSSSGQPQGVVGEVEASTNFSARAIVGYASGNAYAGYFSGRVHVGGQLSKASGSFKIDHPLDPENKYLYHSFVESPDMMNIYNGNVTTDATGHATVELPEWFDALNRDYRYQLTVIGGGEDWVFAKIARKVENNRFTIRTSAPAVEVSWQVTGIRKDAFAERNRIPVEEDKPEVERGKYLHPEVFGQPQEAGVDHAGRPSSRR